MTWRHGRWQDDRPAERLGALVGCDRDRARSVLRGTFAAIGRVASVPVAARVSLGLPPEAASILVGQAQQHGGVRDEASFLGHVRSCVDDTVSRREVRAAIRVIEDMCSASDFERLRAFLPVELDPLTEEADATRTGD